jgi:hypothetical protein
MHTVAFTAVTADTLNLPTPSAVSAAIPLFLIGLLLWRRILPRTAAILALLAGAALRSGWLYTAIHHLLGWANRAIGATTGTLMGGAVPGALALIMLIVYVTELKLDAEVISRLMGARTNARSFFGAGAGYSGGRSFVGVGAGRSYGYREGGRRALTSGRSSERTRKGWPDKIAALVIGLMLPSVVGSIPGTVGALINSVFNVTAGLLAAALAHTIGIR